MAGELAGKTITITTTKSTSIDELKELIGRAFEATTHPRCYSGATLIMRHAESLYNDDSSSITVG